MSDEQRGHPDHPFRLGGAFGTGWCCDEPSWLHWPDYALEIERLQARLAAAEGTISALRAAALEVTSGQSEGYGACMMLELPYRGGSERMQRLIDVLAATVPEGER